MDFLRKKSANLQTLQRAHEESYQASLRAILLEAQNNKAAALSAWQTTKRIIALQLSTITDTPKTSQESAIMSNIMNIERQCYDRIAFLERGGPDTNPYSSYPLFSQDEPEQSHTQSSQRSNRGTPSNAYTTPFSNFSSSNIADAYEPDNVWQSPQSSRKQRRTPPPLPPKVSLELSPVTNSHSYFDVSPTAYQFESAPLRSENIYQPVPPPHKSEYKSRFDPGSQTSLISTTPTFQNTSPKPVRPPVVRRQVSRPSLEPMVSSSSTTTYQSQSVSPKPLPVKPVTTLYSQPVFTSAVQSEVIERIPQVTKPIVSEVCSPESVSSPTVSNPAVKSTPTFHPLSPTFSETGIVNRKSQSASSITSDARTQSLRSESPIQDTRSPSPQASSPVPRPMLLTLRSGKGTMKRFKEERKIASNAASLAWTAKYSSPTNANNNKDNKTLGNGSSSTSTSTSLNSASLISGNMEKMSLSNTKSEAKPRTPTGSVSGPSKILYTKPVAFKTPQIHAPKPTPISKPTSSSIARPKSTPTVSTNKRPSVVTSQSQQTTRKTTVSPAKPSIPVTRASQVKTAPKTASPAKKVQTTIAQPIKRANGPTTVKQASGPNTIKRASGPGTTKQASAPGTNKPAAKPKTKPVEEELDEDEKWLATAKKKVEKVKGIDQHAAEQIFNDVVVKGDPVFWDDIAGLEKAKTSLKETVVYPFLRPDLFSGLREPAQGMLLFGPPGTGKTMLARAVATESNSTFFSISASSLTSKFLGESEKLVRALFLMARALAPSIIFVDEIDSLLSARSDSGEHETSRRIKTEFLVQWSALQHAAAGKEHEDVSRVLVLAATNLPWVIDEAARRRFVRRQYIPLPEPETRRHHLDKLLSRQKHALSPDQFEELVMMTDGFSGSDLTALAKDAAMGPLRSLGEALLTTPTDQIRPIGFEDFVASLKTIRPSVSKEGLKTFEDWAAMYGSSGA